MRGIRDDPPVIYECPGFRADVNYAVAPGRPFDHSMAAADLFSVFRELEVRLLDSGVYIIPAYCVCLPCLDPHADVFWQAGVRCEAEARRVGIVSVDLCQSSVGHINGGRLRMGRLCGNLRCGG